MFRSEQEVSLVKGRVPLLLQVDQLSPDAEHSHRVLQNDPFEAGKELPLGDVVIGRRMRREQSRACLQTRSVRNTEAAAAAAVEAPPRTIFIGITRDVTVSNDVIGSSLVLVNLAQQLRRKLLASAAAEKSVRAEVELLLDEVEADLQEPVGIFVSVRTRHHLGQLLLHQQRRVAQKGSGRPEMVFNS